MALACTFGFAINLITGKANTVDLARNFDPSIQMLSSRPVRSWNVFLVHLYGPLEGFIGEVALQASLSQTLQVLVTFLLGGNTEILTALWQGSVETCNFIRGIELRSAHLRSGGFEALPMMQKTFISSLKRSCKILNKQTLL
jgi:hypothetical protein